MRVGSHIWINIFVSTWEDYSRIEHILRILWAIVSLKPGNCDAKSFPPCSWIAISEGSPIVAVKASIVLKHVNTDYEIAEKTIKKENLSQDVLFLPHLPLRRDV